MAGATAGFAIEIDQGAKAVRLYGAASAQREALALRFSRTQLEAYQQALDSLHQLVPDDVFAVEWEAGMHLGFQAAIILAIEP